MPTHRSSHLATPTFKQINKQTKNPHIKMFRKLKMQILSPFSNQNFKDNLDFVLSVKIITPLVVNKISLTLKNIFFLKM